MAEYKYLTVSLTNKEIEHIFSKIIIDSNDPLGKCWIWSSTIRKRGYGRVRYRSHTESIHRLIYAWLIAPIPRGRYGDIPTLDHMCENPPCCNPFHLRLVSNWENGMRGNSVAAINARKTHCLRGHLLPIEPNDCTGKQRVCKICAAEYRKSHSEKAREYMRQYQQDHRDALLIYIHAYYRNHREVLLEHKREYRRTHKHQGPS